MSPPTYDAPIEENTALCPLDSALIFRALHAVDDEALRILVHDLPCEDLAELLNQMTSGERIQMVEMLGDAFDVETIPYLHPDAREDIVYELNDTQTAAAMQVLDDDDALQLIEELDDDERDALLQAVDAETREEITESLSYPEDSAGRLMRRHFVSVPEFYSVGDTIDYMRSQDDLPGDFYIVFVVDPKFHPVGEVPLARIMQSHRNATLSEIMLDQLHIQPVDRDQEEVAYDFRKYGLVEAPVVNDQGRLVGTITVDDVITVMEEEQEEDILRGGGVRSQDFHSSTIDTVRSRFPWLFINLLTAIAASAVIGLYQSTINHLVVLAILMPIIASMGGNAGIQAATVAVRALATRRVREGAGFSMLRKEFFIGLINGVAIAAVTSVCIWLFYGDIEIALIFAVAIIVTMVAACVCGAALPLLLLRVKADPAISAGVFLTMLTDIIGFFAFLGLASWLLL